MDKHDGSDLQVPEESSDPRSFTEPQYTPEMMAMIQAAMMEELGVRRKDTLPLQDRGLDVTDLPKSKPRSGKRVCQSESTGISAWNNITFDDVDPADAKLDSIADGQLYRIRRDTSTPASFSSRGQSISARGTFNTSRLAMTATPGLSRVSSHTRGNALRGGHISQSSRSGFQDARSRRVDNVLTAIRGMTDNAKPTRKDINPTPQLPSPTTYSSGKDSSSASRGRSKPASNMAIRAAATEKTKEHLIEGKPGTPGSNGLTASGLVASRYASDVAYADWLSSQRHDISVRNDRNTEIGSGVPALLSEQPPLSFSTSSRPELSLSAEDEELLEEHFGSIVKKRLMKLYEEALSQPDTGLINLGTVYSGKIPDADYRQEIHDDIQRIFGSRLSFTFNPESQKIEIRAQDTEQRCGIASGDFKPSKSDANSKAPVSHAVAKSAIVNTIQLSGQTVADMTDIAGFDPLISFSDHEDEAVHQSSYLEDMIELEATVFVEFLLKRIQPDNEPSIIDKLSANVVARGGKPASTLLKEDLLASEIYELMAMDLISDSLTRSEIFSAMPDGMSHHLVQRNTRKVFERAVEDFYSAHKQQGAEVPKEQAQTPQKESVPTDASSVELDHGSSSLAEIIQRQEVIIQGLEASRWHTQHNVNAPAAASSSKAGDTGAVREKSIPPKSIIYTVEELKNLRDTTSCSIPTFNPAVSDEVLQFRHPQSGFSATPEQTARPKITFRIPHSGLALPTKNPFSMAGAAKKVKLATAMDKTESRRSSPTKSDSNKALSEAMLDAMNEPSTDAVSRAVGSPPVKRVKHQHNASDCERMTERLANLALSSPQIAFAQPNVKSTLTMTKHETVPHVKEAIVTDAVASFSELPLSSSSVDRLSQNALPPQTAKLAATSTAGLDKPMVLNDNGGLAASRWAVTSREAQRPSRRSTNLSTVSATPSDTSARNGPSFPSDPPVAHVTQGYSTVASFPASIRNISHYSWPFQRFLVRDIAGRVVEVLGNPAPTPAPFHPTSLVVYAQQENLLPADLIN